MFRWLAFVFILFAAQAAVSQPELKVYRGEISMANITPEQARQRAIQQARLNSIERQCGVNLQAETMVKDFVLSGDFVHSVSYGQVISEKLVKEWVEIDQPAIDQPPHLTYVVEIKIEVLCEFGQPDPSFRITLKANKSTFVTGEEMILNISATQDCYLTVINYSADDKIYFLVPSKIFIENKLTANVPQELPSALMRQQGVHFRMNTMPGQSQSSEVIQVIATKRKINFLDELENENGYAMLPTVSIAGTNLARWLSTIPVSERADAQMVIEIRER